MSETNLVKLIVNGKNVFRKLLLDDIWQIQTILEARNG